MAIPNKPERQKVSSRAPAHRRLLESPGLARAWADDPNLNPAVMPTDPIERAMAGAVAQAEQRSRPLASRKQSEYEQRQEARTAAGKAAQSLLAEEQGETEATESNADAGRIKAAAEAFVAQMTPAELAAVEQASIQRAAKEAQVELAREAADQEAEDEFRAQHIDALGFDPESFSVDETEFTWQDEDEPEAGELS